MNRRNRSILQALGYLPAETTEQAETPDQPEQPAEVDPLAKDRLRAARDNGLPEALADRLRGSTPAEVTVDAIRLAREIKPVPVNGAEVEAMRKRNEKKNVETASLLPPQAWSEREGKDQ